MSAHPHARWGQLLRVSPALAAVAIYGVAQGRLYFALPVAAAMLAAIGLRLHWTFSAAGLLTAGGVGALMGLPAGFVDPGWSPYLPAPALSALCAFVAALTLYCVGTRSMQYAGVYAWVLAALSTDVHVMPPALIAGLGALMLATLWVAMADAQAWAAGGLITLVAGGAFLALAVPGQAALSSLTEASVDPILSTLLRLTEEIPHPHGVALDSELRLRKVSIAPDDDTVLFEITSPSPERLRTLVFDTFDGDVWRTSEAVASQRWKLTGSGDQHADVTFAEEVGPMVPTPAGVTGVRGLPTEVHGGWVVSSPQRLRASTVGLDYDKSEALPIEPAGASTGLPEALAAQLRPLALGIVGGATTSAARASAIAHFFSENFEYSLTTDLSGRDHPLVTLIRSRKPAYCIYFASAAAALLRSLGIPARVVGGFVPGETNPLTGRVAVRAKNAHVWVEFFQEDLGRFVGVDPTPWRSRSALTPPPSPIKQLLDAVRSALRVRYLEAGGTPGQAVLAIFRSRLLIGLLVLAGASRLARNRRRQRVAPPQEARYASDPRLVAAHRAYREILRRAGAADRAFQTERESLAGLSPQSAQAAERFLASYEQARFGGGAIAPDGWKRELDALAGTLGTQKRA